MVDVPKIFMPWFSWWVVITAEETNVEIMWIDWDRLYVSVNGTEENKRRFKARFMDLFNPFVFV